jgi:hypothetical protein
MKQYLPLLSLLVGLSSLALTLPEPENPFQKEFQAILQSDDVQAFFGDGPILVYRSDDLCAKLACENFRLDNGQEIRFVAKEDIFMLGSPKYMEVVIVDRQQDEEILIKYALRRQVRVKY